MPSRDVAPITGPLDPGRQRKAADELARLMRDIAECREGLARREAFAAELERRLHADLQPLEDQVRKVRLETLRILAGHARQGWLKKRSAAALVDALKEFAGELEDHYAVDLGEVTASWRDEEAAPARPQAPRPEARAESAGARVGAEGPSKASRKRAAREEILSGDIRALYLLLARALHPDKEPEPSRREAKTAWMQKVAAAYGERNLAQLLDILARNPMDAVGPYLSQAPARTVQGFAKRLRRELEALRRRADGLPEGFDPAYARWIRAGRVDEADYARRLAERRKDLKIMKARRDAYRHPEAVEALLEELREHDWRLLM